LVKIEEMEAALLESQQVQRYLTDLSETMEGNIRESSLEMGRLREEAVRATNGQSVVLEDTRAERDNQS
jgi:hypothetical protein